MAKKHKAGKGKSKKLRTSRILVSLLVIVLVVLLGYWAWSSASHAAVKTAQNADKGTEVARVNGDSIYSSDIDEEYKMYAAQFGPSITRDFVINQSINELLLLQEAKKEGITVDEQKIKDGVDQWFAQLSQQVSDDQLAAILAQQNLTMEEFRNETTETYRKNFIIFALLNRTVFSTINESQYLNVSFVPTEQEIEDYYNNHTDQYDRINASHILICYNGTPGCQSNRSREEAEQLVNDIYEQLQNNGNFEELAKEYSDGPSATNGGNLGEFSKGQMIKEFEDAAFALKYPNQLSEPVETEYGFHIIKLISKRSGLDAFRNEISLQLQAQKQQEAYNELQQVQQEKIGEYIAALRAKADIKIFTANPSAAGDVNVNPAIQTFSEKEGDICTEDGKPIIRMFSITTCPHCNWVGDTFDSTVKEYVNQGKIVAYHWELDTGDNTLTSVKEDTVPQEETDIYRQFSPQGSVPTFVFGCKYYRIGTGYEQENDLNAEKREFQAVIDELLK